MIQKSNVSTLINRLMNIIEGDGSIKQFFAPLVQFEQMVIKVENQLITQVSEREFGVRRENLQTKISILQEDFFEGIYGCVSNHFDEIYRHCLSNIDISEIWNELVEEIEEFYKLKIVSLNNYMKDAFKELNITVDNNCDVINSQEKLPQIPSNTGELGKSETSVITPKEKSVDSISAKLSMSNDFLSVFLSLFKSKSKKEKEEYDRLCAEAESYNQQQQYLIEEEIRRHQDARTKANALMDDFTRQIKQELRADFAAKYNHVIAEIDNAINYNEAHNLEIQKVVGECVRIREELAVIKNTL